MDYLLEPATIVTSMGSETFYKGVICYNKEVIWTGQQEFTNQSFARNEAYNHLIKRLEYLLK